MAELMALRMRGRLMITVAMASSRSTRMSLMPPPLDDNNAGRSSIHGLKV
jgi:hypothetical protein